MKREPASKDVRDQQFTGPLELETDGRSFTGCRFADVTLVYEGGEHPRFERCEFHSSGWQFRGAALRTIQFLQQINASPGGETFLAGIFKPGAYITE